MTSSEKKIHFKHFSLQGKVVICTSYLFLGLKLSAFGSSLIPMQANIGGGGRRREEEEEEEEEEEGGGGGGGGSLPRSLGSEAQSCACSR